MNLAIDRKKLEKFCKINSIKKLAIFGSALREDFGPTSDIDVLIAFEEGKVPDLFRFIKISEELSIFFDGRRVDLVTYKALRGKHRKEEILKEAKVFYDVAA